MSNASMISALIALKDSRASAAQATALIAQASDDFLVYCGLDEIPPRAENTVVRMAVVLFNRLGAEGISQANFSGVSETYIDGYPAELLANMRRYRRVKTL